MPAANILNNAETCPHCLQVISGSETTVVSGRAWHRKCYESTQTYQVRSKSIALIYSVCFVVVPAFLLLVVVAISPFTDSIPANVLNNMETCPKCNKVVAPTEESTVSKGRTYHRKCFDIEQEFGVPVYN